MKKLPPILFCMLPLLALAFVVSGRAEETKAPSKAMLKKYDANNDGVISDEEKAAGKASAKEAREQRRAEELEKYDANKDGKINPEERAKIKADRDAEKAARKAEREAKKAEREAMKTKRDAK
jgi:hypothetical protein